MKRYKKGDQGLMDLIDDMKRSSYENKAPIWRDVADRLSKPTKNRSEVNLSRIARFAQKDDVLLVPGKLLGSGDIDIPLTVASFKASASAVKKIQKAGGRVITLRELMEENPKGTNVKMMG